MPTDPTATDHDASSPLAVELLQEKLRQMEDELGRTRTLTTRAVILRSSPEAYFRVNFNGVDAWIPGDTLRTMIHCVHGGDEIVVRVEDAHLEWMLSKMAPGGTFLDVGAATGAMTIPFVARFGSSDAKIIAFEPAGKARRLLSETLERNGLLGAEIVPNAVSNEVGTATFYEFEYDETGPAFLPETSALYSKMVEGTQATELSIEVTTLDAFAAGRALRPPVVVKIDVEGFEALVLEGAAQFIDQYRPYFSIDIHKDPFGEGMTDPRVKAFLGTRGYQFSQQAHVLLASPPADRRPPEAGSPGEPDPAMPGPTLVTFADEPGGYRPEEAELTRRIEFIRGISNHEIESMGLVPRLQFDLARGEAQIIESVSTGPA